MPNSKKTPMNNTNTINQTNKSNQSISTATIKTLYSNTLKELVTANTITNTQSKKVLEAITKNMPQGSVTNSSNTATPNTGTTGSTKTTGTTGSTGNTGSTESTGTPGTTGTGTTNSTNQIETTNNTNVVNGLTSLVKSKVITQVQSDTIYQKIQMNLENIQINK